MTIGASRVANAATYIDYLPGAIDEVAYFGAAISADQVQAIPRGTRRRMPLNIAGPVPLYESPPMRVVRAATPCALFFLASLWEARPRKQTT